MCEISPTTQSGFKQVATSQCSAEADTSAVCQITLTDNINITHSERQILAERLFRVFMLAVNMKWKKSEVAETGEYVEACVWLWTEK